MTLAVLAVFLFVVIPGDNGLMDYSSSRMQIITLEKSIDSLNRAIGKIDYLNSQLEQKDPLAIEREARRYDMRYPGETVYRVGKPKKKP